jgi:hypothetical protein
MPDVTRQLELLRELSTTLGRERIRFWLRGGWALDFHPRGLETWPFRPGTFGNVRRSLDGEHRDAA